MLQPHGRKLGEAKPQKVCTIVAPTGVWVPTKQKRNEFANWLRSVLGVAGRSKIEAPIWEVFGHIAFVFVFVVW